MRETGRTCQAARDRAQIAPAYRWDLTHIFIDEAAFEAAFTDVARRIEEAASLRGRLGRSADSMLAVLKHRDELHVRLEQVLLYAGLSHHEDMSLCGPQGRWDRVQSLATRAAEALSWLAPELLSMDAATWRGWMGSNAELAVYRHDLEDTERQRPHVLPQGEEALLAMAGEIARAPEAIFSRFTNTNLDLPMISDESGVAARLTPGLYSALLYSRDRRVRRDAFLGMHEAYRGKRNTLSVTLAAQVRQHWFFARARRFESCLACALDRPNIPAAVYHNLIKAVRRHVPQLHRYLAIRRKLLGLEALHVYDLYVPLVDAPRQDIGYDAAVETVLEACGPLGKEYVGAVRQGTSSRWVDVYETPNKRSGAYSWGSYLTHPYLMLNYQGTERDRSTVAHELGHAMHSLYTTRAQPPVYGDYATFCAEVASTVNEVLLAAHLLERAASREERLFILCQQAEAVRTTVFRQTLFAEFELRIHAEIEAGRPLTGDRLDQLYVELVRSYYGPELVLDDCAGAECLRIPHFYRNFYVYTYATSHCAAIDVGRRILSNSPGAREGFLAFLSAGSSRYPLDVLRLAGVDLATAAPIDSALNFFAGLLDEIERLTS
jgi:oligoendopeptidase F